MFSVLGFDYLPDSTSTRVLYQFFFVTCVGKVLQPLSVLCAKVPTKACLFCQGGGYAAA